MACDFCRTTPVDPCPVCGPVSHAGNTRIRKLPKALRNAIANATPKAFGSPKFGPSYTAAMAGAPVPGANSRARYTPPSPTPPGMIRSPVPTHIPGAKVAIPKFVTVAQAIDAGRDGTRRAAAETIRANERRIRELEDKLRANPTPLAPVATVPPTRANPTPPPPIARQRPAQPARMGILTPITPEDWRAAERFVRSTLWAPKLPATVDAVATVVTQRDEEATHPPISRGDFRGLWVAVEAGHLSEADAIEIAASWRGPVGVAS